MWRSRALIALALVAWMRGGAEAQDPEFPDFPKVAASSEVQRAVCGRSSRCRVVWKRSAGSLPDGRELDVIRVARLAPAKKWEGVGEVWFVFRKGRSVVGRQLLTRDAKWSHTEMLEDPTNSDPGFEVSNNRFREFIVSYHGSRGVDVSMQLHPLRVLSELREKSHTSGGEDGSGYFSLSWNWPTFSGIGENQAVDRCEQDDSDNVFERDVPFLPIPHVSMKLEFAREGWRAVRLGDCALALGEVNSPGYLLAGWRDETRPEVVIKLLLVSDQDLLVEIPKADFVDSETGWLKSDHLEIWQEDDGGRASQWGIRLSDGAIFPAHNRPQRTPTVERVKGPAGSNFTLLKIHLAYKAAPESHLSVSYSGSRGGRGVGLLLSTSRVCFGHEDTLSMVKSLAGRAGRCEVVNGSLNWNPEPKIRPDEALFDLTHD